ncbi:MAG: DUF6142 family protein [Lachnospira sp.]|nr:DUF6142 family protein [Lachnospira sp.]MDD5829206.1 DUF6142 family protein [Lachnospira sp.]
MKLFNKYKFSDKSQTLGGTISTLMGLLSFACLAYGVYISFKAKGHAGLRVGTLGLLSLMIAAIGTAIGLMSFKEDDKFYTLSKVGSLLCGIITVFMIAVFLMGI